MRRFLHAVCVAYLIVVSSPLAFGASLVEESRRSGQRQEQVGQLVEAGAVELEKGNFSQALQLFQLAASQGNAEGQAAISVMHAYGLGVQKDCAVALSLCHDAIASGSPVAQYNIGVMYANGVCLEKNEGVAIEWYAKAASNKNSTAMFILGSRYINGVGVPKNEAEGLRLIREAAEQGLAQAQINIGTRCVYGVGVPKDMVQAGKWFRMAAKQGDPSGQTALGAIYAEFGTYEDDVQAYKWASLAAAQGYSKAKELLRLLSARLTEGQKAEALNQARDWRPSRTQHRISKAYLADSPDAKASDGQTPTGFQPMPEDSESRFDGFVGHHAADGPTGPFASQVEAAKARQSAAHMLSGNYGPELAQLSGLKHENTPEQPAKEQMGFWEGAWGQQKQNLIPKAYEWANKEKFDVDLRWKNPVMDDPDVLPQFWGNFADVSSQKEYDQIKERLKAEMEWEERVNNATGMGKFGALVSRVLDPALISVVAVLYLIFSPFSSHYKTQKPHIIQSISQSRSVQSRKTRTMLAWIVGLATTYLLVWGLNSAIHSLGIPTFIDSGGDVVVERIYGRVTTESVESGSYTVVGQAILLVGPLIGFLAGYIVAHWPRKPLMDADTRSLFCSSLVFFVLYGVGGAAIILVFGEINEYWALVLSNILKLCLLVASYLFARKTYDKIQCSGDAANVK